MVNCLDCERERSEKHMTEAIFPDTGKGSGAWHCSNRESCRQERKRRRYEGVRCSRCGHPRFNHEKTMEFEDFTLVECSAHVGMGNWCGCPVKREDI